VVKFTLEWRLKPILIDPTRVYHVVQPSDDAAERKSGTNPESQELTGDDADDEDDEEAADEDKAEDNEAEETIQARKSDLLADTMKTLQEAKDAKAAFSSSHAT
jgi:hypothetical protein